MHFPGLIKNYHYVALWHYSVNNPPVTRHVATPVPPLFPSLSPSLQSDPLPGDVPTCCPLATTADNSTWLCCHCLGLLYSCLYPQHPLLYSSRLCMGVTNWHTLLFMSFWLSGSRWGRTRLTALWQSTTEWKARGYFFGERRLILSCAPINFHLAFVEKKVQESNTTYSLTLFRHYNLPISLTSTVTMFFEEEESKLDQGACFDVTAGIRFFISTGTAAGRREEIPKGRLCANMPIVMQSPVKAEGW